MDTKQAEVLRLANILRGIDARSLFANEKLSAASAALENQHARITEMEAQLAQRFDAADMATAAAQGFRDGAASVANQPITDTNTASGAAERDALLQAALDFIQTLTGMKPPPIEVAPPEVFAPFRAFVDRVQAITSQRAALASTQAQPSWLKYNPSDDVLTIHGKRYAAAIFGEAGFLSPPGTLLRVESGHPDCVTLHIVAPAQPVADPVIAGSVLEDAARYRWLCCKFGETHFPCALENLLEQELPAPVLAHEVRALRLPAGSHIR